MKRTPIEELIHALRPFVESYERQYDPGTDDLDGDQPMAAYVTLGALRRAQRILREVTR